MVVLAATLTHVTTVDHPWVIDDGVQISENPAVTRGASLGAYFFDRTTTSTRPDYNTRIYRPLRNAAFRAVVVLSRGAHPLAFGLCNLVLYAGVAVLVMLLALELTGSLFASAWAAGLWAVMPVHVEPVAYASAFGDQLSAVLQVGALLTAWRVVKDQKRAIAPSARLRTGPSARLRTGPSARLRTGPSARLRTGLGAASLALQLGAMLTKEMAVTTVGLLALGVLLEPEARRARRSWALVAAHLTLALAYLALRTHVVGQMGQEAITGASIAKGLREAPLLLLGYLRISVAPLGHRTAYVVPAPSNAQLALALLSLAAAASLAVWWDRRAKRPPGVLFGLGWFVLSLAPVLHLVPLWADLADRFALVPSVGLALAAAFVLARVPETRRRLAQVGAGALALLYVAGTFAEAPAWKSDLALWSHAVADEPGSALAHSNLGAVYLQSGRPDEALKELDNAEALGKSDAYVDLRRGMALETLGRASEAELVLRRAIRRDPELGRAHALLGEVLRRQGRLDQALASLEKAQKYEPGHPSTWLLAGALFEQQQRWLDAAQAFGRLRALYPAEPRFVYLHGRALLATGKPADALAAAIACGELAHGDQPQCACLEGRALLITGQPEAARRRLDAALGALPDGPEKELCRQARAAAGP